MSSILPMDFLQCNRLATFPDAVKTRCPDYYGKPVSIFGDEKSILLIIGLEPGMHEAKRTGKPFQVNIQSVSFTRHYINFFTRHHESITADDDLALIQCRNTNAVNYLPLEKMHQLKLVICTNS